MLDELAEPMLNEVSYKLDELAVSRLHYVKFSVKVPFPLQEPTFHVTERSDAPGPTQLCAGRVGAVASGRAMGVPLSGQTRCSTLHVVDCRCVVHVCMYTAHQKSSNVCLN